MSALSDARGLLYEALADRALDHQWRVHEYTPDRVDPPAIFVGGATVSRETVGTPGVSMFIVTFPIYAVADGLPSQQTRTLDEMIAVVWDACVLAGASPDVARPTPLDVGGTTLRGALVQADMTLRALTLCTPSLETATHG